MSESKSTTPTFVSGVFFIVVGILILILSVLNYLQDEKISLVTIVGIMGISLGLFMLSGNKKSNLQDE